MTLADPPPPPSGRSVFDAASIVPARDFVTVLGPDDVRELEAAASPIVARGEGALLELAATGARAFPLPSLGKRLLALRAELLGALGFAVLRGLPVSRYTPLEVATLLLGMGTHVGLPRRQNTQGDLLGHVCDLGLTSADPSVRIYQTRERQTFHTDSCDVVALLCLREAMEGGDSLVVSAGAVYRDLHRRDPALLRRLLSPMAHDRRGELPPNAAPFFLLPVFSWFERELTVFYQRQYIESAQRFSAAPRLHRRTSRPSIFLIRSPTIRRCTCGCASCRATCSSSTTTGFSTTAWPSSTIRGQDARVICSVCGSAAGEPDRSRLPSPRGTDR